VRIAFFGLPLAAWLLHQDGHDLVYAGICRKGAIGTRRLARTIGPARVAVKPNVNDPSLAEAIAAEAPDLVVSWFWTTRLPPRILRLAPKGAFGVHPSLLPRHRGPDPYFWAIDAGDDVTGVTAHRLAEEYDTGAILGARTLAIDPAWNAWTLAKRLDRPSLALLRETARAFERGDVAERPQDETKATLAPEPDDDMLTLRWNSPTAEIERRVRAASPWPGAGATIGEVDLTVTRVRAASDVPRALHPGEAAVQAGRAIVRTADGAIELLEGRADASELPLQYGLSPRKRRLTDLEPVALGPADFVRLVGGATAS
jgi:methionyl-tRNA formyltransferase